MRKTILSIISVISLFSFANEEDVSILSKLSNQEAAEYVADSTTFSLPIQISKHSNIKGLRAVNGVLWVDIYLDNTVAEDKTDLVNIEAEEAEINICKEELFKAFMNNNKGQITFKFIHDNGISNLEYKITKC